MKTDEACAYCGDWFQCRDHVIPFSMNYVRKRVHADKFKGTVPCCIMCNAMKSDHVFDSFEAIAGYLISRYTARFARLLKLPHWEPDEIAQLDWTLRTKVVSSQNAKRLIQSKLANLVMVENGLAAVPLSHYEPGVYLFVEEKLK